MGNSGYRSAAYPAPEPELDYIQILRGVLRRRMKLVIGAFTLIALCLFGWFKFGQRTHYQSKGVVQIKPSIVDMFPGTQDLPVGSTLSVQLAVLRSRRLAEDVLDALPQETLDELIKEKLESDYLLILSNIFRKVVGKSPLEDRPREQAMRELRESRMKFATIQGEGHRGPSGLVEISSTAFKPRVAMDLVNTYVQVLVNWSRRSEQEDVAATQKFLELQLSRVQKDLQESEAALAKFVRQPGAIKTSPDQLSPLSEGQVKMAASENLRARLAQLETALIEMRAKYTEEHPSLMAMREEIQSLRSQLGRSPASLPKDSSGESDYVTLLASVQSNRTLLSFLSQKLFALRVRAQSEGPVVRIIDPPNLPSSPVDAVSPKTVAFLLVFAVGAAGGLGFLVEYIYEPIESERTIRGQVDLPFLGSALAIPSRRPNGDGRPLLIFNQRRSAAIPQEFYRSIRANLEAANLRAPFKAIMFTSPLPGEGKSTTALNVAMTLKELGRRVVLVDADLRRPSLSQLFSSDGKVGLSNLLHASQNVANATLPVNVSMEVMGVQPASDFVFIPAGDATDDPGALLSSARARELVSWLKRGWDYVIFDSPPILLVSDNVLFAKSMDGAILVAHSGKTKKRDLQRAKSVLEEADVRILGVILNQVPPSQLPYSYRRYKSYYTPRRPYAR